jgi:hypothetical protein
VLSGLPDIKFGMDMYLQPVTLGEALLVQHKQVLFHENQARSQNEQTLYNAWIQEKGVREHLEATLRNMQHQITALQQKLSIQENINTNKINHHNQPTASIQYEMGKDESPKEVEWITASSRKNKKRKINLSPDRRMNSETPHQIKGSERKEPKPPPIFVSNINYYDTLYTTLSKNGISFKITTLNNEQVKINTEDRQAFKSTTICLKELSLQWHSYEDKQMRDLKVMARGLPPNSKLSENY